MASSLRPRRSALYIPGSNMRRLEKGRDFEADMLILDLEDAVTPDEKGAARDKIKTVLANGGFPGQEILIRINDAKSEWGLDDVKTMAASGADGLLIPKVESADTIQMIADLMDTHEAPADMTLWCMMETPLGILRAEEIATAHPKVTGFMMGTNDLAKDLFCLNTPERLPMVTSLSLCLLVARAYGLAILDGVHPNISDDAGFKFSCQQGLEFGFDGKTLIHPKTITAANEIFGPSVADIARATEIIKAFNAGKAKGLGAVTLADGQLVESLHAKEAERLVALAKVINESKREIS